LVELRAREPLIDVILFRNGAFTTFNLVVFTAQFSKIAVFVFAALYLQNVVGFGALIAGVMILFGTIPTVISAYPTGIVLDRIGSRTLLLGAAGMAALAMFWMCFAVVRESYLLAVPALIVWGFCISVLFVPALRDVMMAVPAEKRGEAGGISMTAQLLGGTVGMTICGALIATTSNFVLVYLVTGALFVLLFVLIWVHVAPMRQTSGTD
ncbi:MAG: MFS transporter, partial [Pseudomonadota bacterium]